MRILPKFSLCAISLTVMAALLATATSVYAATDLVAKVGNVPVTNYELQREIRKRIPLESGYHMGVKEDKIAQIKADALDRLVERAYKVQYALANELSVPPADLDARMQSFLGQYAGPAQLAKALGGESLDAYRASVYRDLLAAKAEQVAVDSKITSSEQELKDYYTENRKRFFRPLQFKASHILIKVDPAASAEDQAKQKTRAEGLLEKARAGEDFYNLAYYESDDRSRYVGGSLGTFHEGQTVEEFDKALKALKPGEISGLVRTRWGYHIIKLDERNEARQLEYDEVKAQIKASLEKERREKRYKDWLDDLRKRYPVEKMP
jgi:parvulin-like peptidyl-prolyl isomerase